MKVRPCVYRGEKVVRIDAIGRPRIALTINRTERSPVFSWRVVGGARLMHYRIGVRVDVWQWLAARRRPLWIASMQKLMLSGESIDRERLREISKQSSAMEIDVWVRRTILDTGKVVVFKVADGPPKTKAK